MKKILVFTSLLVLTLLLSLSPPTIYANSTGAVGQFYNEYKPDYIQFDNYYWNEYITPYVRVELPYVINKLSGTSGPQEVYGNYWSNDTDSYESLLFGYSTLSSSTNNIPLQFIVDCSKVIFYWDTLIYSTSNVPIIQFENVRNITSYSYSFEISTTGSGPSYSSTMANGQVLNFGNILNQFPAMGSGVRLFKNVKIEFDCSDLEFCELIYTTTYRTESNLETKSDLLLNSGIVTPTPPLSNNNVGTWLLDSLNSFLSFELFPGFNLSGLLALLVGIPLLLWLFKMLFGG